MSPHFHFRNISVVNLKLAALTRRASFRLTNRSSKRTNKTERANKCTNGMKRNFLNSEINTDSTALFRATFGDHISDSPYLLHRISRNIIDARNVVDVHNTIDFHIIVKKSIRTLRSRTTTVIEHRTTRRRSTAVTNGGRIMNNGDL